jgi:hypothetical protein
MCVFRPRIKTNSQICMYTYIDQWKHFELSKLDKDIVISYYVSNIFQQNMRLLDYWDVHEKLFLNQTK